MPQHELTEVEIKKIKEEIAHRQTEVTPQCIAEVQRTRALGDLSENDEIYTLSLHDALPISRRSSAPALSEICPRTTSIAAQSATSTATTHAYAI